MRHDVDIEREHPDLDSALCYLKRAGFLNLWGGKILYSDGTLYASIGNNRHPEEICFKAHEGDLQRIQNLMEEKNGH